MSGSGTREGLSRPLAGFASALTLDDIPANVRERVKDLILDTLGSALAGKSVREAGMLLDSVTRLMGSGTSPLIGGGSATMAGASLVNGYRITASNLCDIHRAISCHITPTVVPPALAAAAERGATGAQLLVAITAGLEIVSRIGLGIEPHVFRSRGWHAPGVYGPFGGAAAAGSIFGFDAERMNHAFGIAGSNSSGSYAQVGSHAIKLNQARGGMSGLYAAIAADSGFTGSQDSLTHPDGGLYLTHAIGGRPDVALHRLGTEWALEGISLRPWPVGAHLQVLIQALSDAVQDGVSAADVERVRVSLPAAGYRLHGTMGFDSPFTARLSPRYLAAVVLTDRACRLAQFTPERVADTELQRFASERVQTTENPSLPRGAILVDITLRDGSDRTYRRDVPYGDVADPMRHDDIVEKFRDCAAGLPAERVDAVIEAVGRLESEPSAAAVVTLLDA